MILASLSDSGGEAVTVDELGDLDTIEDDNITFVIVRNGKNKSNEQYKRDRGEWVLCEIDWAEIYTELLAHTSMSPDDISNSSIPFIEAIRARLGTQISLKIGIPFGGSPTSVIESDSHELNKPGETPSINDIMGFCSGFGAGG